LISEVDALKQTNREIIDSIDKRKKDDVAYENILKTLNPVYAKE
jgi:hypothetical protein